MSGIVIRGLPELRANLEEVKDLLKGGQMRGPLAAGAEVFKSGITRRIHGLGLIDTGFMVNSVQSEVPKNDEAVAFVGAEYAIYHEFGTSRGLPSRPFVRPTLDEDADDARDAVAHGIKALLRRFT